MSASGAGRGRAASLVEAWIRLHPEQRVAAVASILLIASTLGPFSFVELAEILTALAVLALLKQRADGRAFHLPFGDGTAIFAAGVWSGLLIATRILDRPPGMSVLALVCALLLAAAGLRERAKRAPDDLPELAAPAPPKRTRPPAEPSRPAARPTNPAARARAKAGSDHGDPTRQLSFEEDVTAALPERKPPERAD